MKQKLMDKIVKGAVLSGAISIAANLITLKEPGYLNVLIGIIIGTVIYLMFHMK